MIEDDPDISYSIRFNLEQVEGWRVETAATGASAIELLDSGPTDLVLLDLNLPDMEGLNLFQQIRRHPLAGKAPVVMLTARTTERDRVRGLDLGADDYVTKPFSMAELVARVRAHLRRESRTADPAGERYQDGELSVDPAERRAQSKGKDIRLTKTEFDLLWLLVSNRNRVLSRRVILEKLWTEEEDVDERTVDVHVHSLRRKLGGDRIETVIGVGYRYRSSEKQTAP